MFTYYPSYETGPGQSHLLSEKTGGRIAHERPMGAATLVYGLDLLQEKTSQPLIDGRTSIPELDQFSYAPFLQVDFPVGDRWVLRGGVRHERVRVDVPTFRNKTDSDPTTIDGGNLDYDETVFNVGAVRYLTERQELFASFSQGFSVADIGRVLRSASAEGTATSAEALDPEAQVVDNYELGWRGYFERVDATASVFYNTPDLGTTFAGPPDFRIQRQKERIYGVELTVDYRATDNWTFGGQASWQEGRVDTDSDGSVDDYLDNTRIAPPKLLVYGEYAPSDRWSGRVQVQRLFDRDRFDGDAFGQGDVDGYTLIDLSGTWVLGPGALEVGVANLLDRIYITHLGQSYNLPGYVIAGRGRTLSVAYGLDF